MQTEGFWITICGIITAFLGSTLKMMYKSKCQHIKCCCFDIEREINAEMNEDLAIINNNNNIKRIDTTMSERV